MKTFILHKNIVFIPNLNNYKKYINKFVFSSYIIFNGLKN